MIRGARGFQIEAEEEQGELLPCGRWRAAAAELELERLWRQVGGAGGGLRVWGSDRE